ncbi:FliA/WhiG family RNA polymerase sigma factor [Metallumcola ferriviriculae]|uniref:FliA/WhiG family RNA polymerase sigma factor n=1 Tax=Metallumcola ferriviriculae TaxID=3039180 RepID=A0AAU0UTF7_9FIRM|nr:FliA/WhiG family RNA polymerase sigma factor [Desulfitibacteraceae bacterium MK1]
MGYPHAKLWDAYFQGEKDLRGKLIETYLPLVKKVVGRLQVAIPKIMDEQDLTGFGVLGLMDAMDKFDPSRGINFEAYAAHRIRGSIIDEIRKNYWVPRSVMEKIDKIQKTAAVLEQKLKREVSEEEVALELGMSAGEIYRITAQINYLSLTHLEEMLFDEGNQELKDIIPDPASAPEQLIENKIQLEMLSEALRKLPEREKLVLSLYYYEELTLKEIGLVLEVSESRISQLHSRAISKLRSVIVEDGL